jgi:plasmid stability protein
VTERTEDEREDELLRTPLDEERRPGQEELAALGVELAERPEALVGGKRLRLEDRRPARRAVLDQRKLLEPGDVEEGGGVGRVDDLVAGRGELAESR